MPQEMMCYMSVQLAEQLIALLALLAISIMINLVMLLRR